MSSDDDITRAAKAAAKALNQWPLVIVLVLVGVGFVVTWWSWPVGCLLVAAALVLAALLRLLLPARAAGLLQVRSRGFDVVFLLVAAIGIATLVILRLQGG